MWLKTYSLNLNYTFIYFKLPEKPHFVSCYIISNCYYLSLPLPTANCKWSPIINRNHIKNRRICIRFALRPDARIICKTPSNSFSNSQTQVKPHRLNSQLRATSITPNRYQLIKTNSEEIWAYPVETHSFNHYSVKDCVTSIKLNRTEKL